MSLFLFFSSHGAHRVLHSFPTRRSSDLAIALRMIPRLIPTMEDLGLPASVRGFATLKQGMVLVTGPTGSGRSEEHTSELQSHVNLVCRLLLEKKKKQAKHERKARRTTED